MHIDIYSNNTLTKSQIFYIFKKRQFLAIFSLVSQYTIKSFIQVKYDLFIKSQFCS